MLISKAMPKPTLDQVSTTMALEIRSLKKGTVAPKSDDVIWKKDWWSELAL